MCCDASLTIFLSCKPLPLYEVGVFLYESCRKIMEIVLKYVGPLYNSAVHAMEPRCGEDPPYPCMPNPIPISQCSHISSISPNTLTGSPKHIQEYSFIPKHIQRGSPIKTKWPPPTPFPFSYFGIPHFQKKFPMATVPFTGRGSMCPL
jgi:hypothetical protein